MPKAAPKSDPTRIVISPVKKGETIIVAICGMPHPVQKRAEEDGLYFSLSGAGFYASARTIWNELDKLLDMG